METNKKMPKNAGFFFCENCDFKCSKISNYNKHLSTDKHKRLIKTNKKCQKMPKIEKNECSCGKSYKHLSSLYKHKKICKLLGENTIVNINTPKRRIFFIILFLIIVIFLGNSLLRSMLENLLGNKKEGFENYKETNITDLDECRKVDMEFDNKLNCQTASNIPLTPIKNSFFVNELFNNRNEWISI